MKKITAKVMSFFMMFTIVFTLVSPPNVAYATINSPVNINVKSDANGVVDVSGDQISTDSPVKKFVKFIQFVSIIGILAMLLVFIINLIKLGTSSTNSRARSAAIEALIWSGVSIAVLGISQLVFFFFFRMLQ